MFLGSEKACNLVFRQNKKIRKFQAVDDQCQRSGTYKCLEKAGAQAGLG